MSGDVQLLQLRVVREREEERDDVLAERLVCLWLGAHRERGDGAKTLLREQSGEQRHHVLALLRRLDEAVVDHERRDRAVEQQPFEERGKAIIAERRVGEVDDGDAVHRRDGLAQQRGVELAHREVDGERTAVFRQRRKDVVEDRRRRRRARKTELLERQCGDELGKVR